MTSTLTNRHELVFIYDSRFANPNGDPTENNELRMIGDRLYVTDVRLKRTIRDYLSDSLEKEIFVKATLDDKWDLVDVKWRLKKVVWTDDEKKITIADIEKLKQEYMDIRLFGSAIKMKLTGPVQFNFGESMHDIQQVKVQWTTVFPSGTGKAQGTFTEMFMTPYSIIAFHGIANEQAAITTGMTDEDFIDLKDAMRNGTKNLITRSKFEQLPRVLIDVVFKKWMKTHIGELDKYITLVLSQEEKMINDITDVTFDFAQFIQRVEKFADKIEKVDIKLDQRVQIQNLASSIVSLAITTL